MTRHSISTYVREQFFAGVHDPEEIARRYLTDALEADDPDAWLLPAIRHSVGASFSSIQAAVRGTQPSNGTAQDASGPARQRHNEGYVYNPDTREWIPLGKATISDFTAAIRWHEKMIEGHHATIDEYRTYIKKIREAGVTCLDET
jgi:hypothetical protein